ncbi:MAG: hypothetical protein NVS9B7_24800 [Flavisolibacter sp.]
MELRKYTSNISALYGVFVKLKTKDISLRPCFALTNFARLQVALSILKNQDRKVRTAQSNTPANYRLSLEKGKRESATENNRLLGKGENVG